MRSPSQFLDAVLNCPAAALSASISSRSAQSHRAILNMFVVGSSKAPALLQKIDLARLDTVEAARPGDCLRRWDYQIEWDQASLTPR